MSASDMIRIEVKLQDKVSRALQAIMEAGRDLRPVLLDMGEHMRLSIERNFEAGGRPRKWKPSIRASREGGQTLVERSHLVGSIHPHVSGNILEVGTNVKYAAIHHFGGVIRPKGKKFLTIPFPGVQRTAGSYADTFVVWKGLTKKKRAAFGGGQRMVGIIYQKEGKDRVKPLFMLRKEVKLPARPFLLVQTEDQRYLLGSARDYLSRAWDEA